MRVDPNNDLRHAGIQPKKQQSTAHPNGNVDLTQSAAMHRTLENTPVVRPDKVAAAKVLIQDPSYPNDATLDRIADLLARHLKPGKP